MTTLNTITRLSGITCLVLILLCSCTTVYGQKKKVPIGISYYQSSKDSTVNTVHYSTKQNNAYLPFESDEYNVIRSFVMSAYAIDSGGQIFRPLYVEPLIPARKLVEYLALDTISFAGFRVYAGLTEDFRVVPILCLTDSDKSFNEVSYRILLDNDYNIKPFPMSSTRPVAASYYRRFIEKVKVFGQSQINDSSAKGRFYHWKDIRNLLTSNIHNFDLSDPLTYEQFSVQMEIGFIPDVLAFELHKIFPAPSVPTNSPGPNDYKRHIGFTGVFHILDSLGNPKIDPTVRRNPERPHDYENLYLEVGSPCPPTCGDLDQSFTPLKK